MGVNPMTRSEQVLAFWFGAPDEAEYGKQREKWFKKDPAFDDEIRLRFRSLYDEAVQGRLDHWQGDAHGCLALILVLDQFSRNMFRDSAKAFAADAEALVLARHATAQGFDKTMPLVHRTFYYLPFEHSEDLQDQLVSVELFRACERHDGYQRSLDYALRHMEVIQRFGRFPHRNETLGRESTPEEVAFLKQSGRGF